jgi:hypothetical protein
MCHLLCVLNEDKWNSCKFWWSSMIRVCDLTYREEGWAMLLQYFGYVVETSLSFKDVILSTVMWHLRFANRFSQHNTISAIWRILGFYFEWQDFMFDDLCYSSPGMWVNKCTTCRESAVLLFPFQVNPWRMWELSIFAILCSCQCLGHCINVVTIILAIWCVFFCSTRECFYMNVCAVIVKMGNV